MNLGAFPSISVPTPTAFTAGGRLTLVTGSSVIASDQASKTVVYYTPHLYGAAPIIRDGVVRPAYFTDDLKLTLTSAHAANAIYDVFLTELAGKPWIGTGPAWTTATAGSGARGTGGGTTELTRAAGMSVNRYGIPLLNAEGSTVIEPLNGMYLGSLLMDGSAGQVTCHVGYGQSRKFGVWNAINRQPIVLKAGDSTASWTYNTNTLRASNNAAANSLTAFQGLTDETVDVKYQQHVSGDTATNVFRTGIGWNSTSAISGIYASMILGASMSVVDFTIPPAEYVVAPFLGSGVATSLEAVTAAGTNTWYGTESKMLLTARYNG